MSLVDTVISTKTDDLVVQRRARGSIDDDGVWQPGAATTLPIEACVQPATGMQRVVGGRDMRSDDNGQHTDDVRVIYTPSLVFTRDEIARQEPDQVLNFEGGTWTIIRVEKWQDPDDPTDVVYRALMTKETRGAS